MFALVSFIIVIGVCVVSHEFGHFLSAKLLAFKYSSSPWHGPAIFKRERDALVHQDLSNRSFVRLAGMGEALDDETEDPKEALTPKAHGAGGLYGAGSITNVVLAVIIATFFYGDMACSIWNMQGLANLCQAIC